MDNEQREKKFQNEGIWTGLLIDSADGVCSSFQLDSSHMTRGFDGSNVCVWLSDG